MKYEEEVLSDYEDDETMRENVDELRQAVVGHKIVNAERSAAGRYGSPFVITLDNGRKVKLRATNDCCAYTDLDSFLLNVENVDHVITGVGTTDGFEKWHIYADMGDVLELRVGWSPGNPFYYAYGFEIEVEES